MPLQGRAETTFASEIEALVGDREAGDQREQPGMRWRSHQYSPQSQTNPQEPETPLTDNATEGSISLGGVSCHTLSIITEEYPFLPAE